MYKGPIKKIPNEFKQQFTMNGKIPIYNVFLDEKSSLYSPPQAKVLPLKVLIKSVFILYFLNIDHSLSVKSSPTTPISETFVYEDAATPKYVAEPPKILFLFPLTVFILSNAIEPTANMFLE